MRFLLYEDAFQLVIIMCHCGGLGVLPLLSRVFEHLVPVRGTDWRGLGGWRSASLGLGIDNLRARAVSTSVSASCLGFKM